MRCVKIRDRGEILCLPKEQIEKIEMNPDIQKVPGSCGGIRGIGWYKEAIIVYYGVSCDEGINHCGILWRQPGKNLIGLLAEEILEETEPVQLDEELQKLLEYYGLRTGENQSDTTK